MFERSWFWPFLIVCAVIIGLNIGLAFLTPWVLMSLIVFGPLMAIGLHDCFQTKHSILRNYPIAGHFRFMLEAIRPEIHQYFVESDTDGKPFDRRRRRVVYQRAKKTVDTIAFGSLTDFYRVGYEWVNHSLSPLHVQSDSLRVEVGGPDCKQPYSASILNISAMSFGALSSAAVRALNGGARIGGFAHNTGEGGLSPYHLQEGGDIFWQIGTGYFGCRTHEGDFDSALFQDKARHPHVKMIELKLSQGAKPGHGGILPARKISSEIAEIRHVPMGKDCLSPPAHKAFTTPCELMEFIARMRELSGGKPVGFKLCVGKRREFIAICKAMLDTGITPDFITVDGGEGGTGAAPLEFAGSIGCPATEALIFVHNVLVGFGLRDKVRVINSGKIAMGFDIIKRLSIGADMCNAARAFMMSVGCIQALKCNQNVCPVGVTTQKPELVRGLNVADKRVRCAQFHDLTMKSVAEMLGAMGLACTKDLRPWHVMRRSGPDEVKHYGELFHYLQPGDLLKEPLPPEYARAVLAAQSCSFEHTSPDKPREKGELATEPATAEQASYR